MTSGPECNDGANAIIICKSCNATNSAEDRFCKSCMVMLNNPYRVQPSKSQSKSVTITCSACNADNEGTRQFCKSCGKWLNNVTSNIVSNSQQDSNTPVAGCLSVLAIPLGIFIAFMFFSRPGIHDSWGFGIMIFTILFVLVAAIFGIIAGIFALTPGKNSDNQSKTNSTLGLIGITIGIIVIMSILILFKG